MRSSQCKSHARKLPIGSKVCGQCLIVNLRHPLEI